MTVISRLKLDHPPLATTGGSGLHAQIAAIYQKIGDGMNSRFFWQNLTNGSSADFDHNLNVPFAELRYELYDYDDTTGVLTRINPTTGFTIVGTPSFTTTQVRVTNSTGGTRKIAIVLIHDPISLEELEDVTTAGVATGNFLTYNGTNWAPSNTTITGKVIDGTSDQVQLIVQGHSTQTTNILELQNSAGTVEFAVNNTGTATATANIVAGGALTSNTGSIMGNSSTTIGPGVSLTYTGSGTQAWLGLVKGTGNTTSGVANDYVIHDSTASRSSVVCHAGASSGIVTLPENSSVYAALGATIPNTTYASGTTQKISFVDSATNGFDQRGEWNNTNFNFTATVSGRYLVTTCVRFISSGTSTLILLQLFKGGSVLRDFTLPQGSFPNGTEVGASTVVKLAAAEVIDVRAFVVTAGTWGIEVLDGGSAATWITVDKIG